MSKWPEIDFTLNQNFSSRCTIQLFSVLFFVGCFCVFAKKWSGLSQLEKTLDSLFICQELIRYSWPAFRVPPSSGASVLFFDFRYFSSSFQATPKGNDRGLLQFQRLYVWVMSPNRTTDLLWLKAEISLGRNVGCHQSYFGNVQPLMIVITEASSEQLLSFPFFLRASLIMRLSTVLQGLES